MPLLRFGLSQNLSGNKALKGHGFSRAVSRSYE
jgi:hypothetical protein